VDGIFNFVNNMLPLEKRVKRIDTEKLFISALVQRNFNKHGRAYTLVNGAVRHQYYKQISHITGILQCAITAIHILFMKNNNIDNQKESLQGEIPWSGPLRSSTEL
jgi:hypothetical protein